MGDRDREGEGVVGIGQIKISVRLGTPRKARIAEVAETIAL